MLDLQFIRDNADRVRKAMQNKGIGDGSLVDTLLEAAETRRELITKTQTTPLIINMNMKADMTATTKPPTKAQPKRRRSPKRRR